MQKTSYISNAIKLSFVAVIFLVSGKLCSQEHYFGIRGGYGISTASYEPYMGDIKSVSGIDFGVAYKLYAEKYMGTQIELSSIQTGYQLADTTYTGRAVELPLMAQGFLRFGGFRVFLNAGVFGSYIISQDIEKPDDSGIMHTQSYSFTDRDKRFDYGILGGGGFAFQLKKIELQIEARYQYGFGYIMKPRYKADQTIFSNRSRLAFSFALFYNL